MHDYTECIGNIYIPSVVSRVFFFQGDLGPQGPAGPTGLPGVGIQGEKVGKMFPTKRHWKIYIYIYCASIYFRELTMLTDLHFSLLLRESRVQEVHLGSEGFQGRVYLDQRFVHKLPDCMSHVKRESVWKINTYLFCDLFIKLNEFNIFTYIITFNITWNEHVYHCEQNVKYALCNIKVTIYSQKQSKQQANQSPPVLPVWYF